MGPLVSVGLQQKFKSQRVKTVLKTTHPDEVVAEIGADQREMRSEPWRTPQSKGGKMKRIQ